MEELTESARQYLVSQAIVTGSISILISLGLSVLGILVTTRNSDILHFISLYQLAILETACGMTSLIIVLYVWWIVSGYRNRQLIVRSKYLDEKLSKGLMCLILPLFLTFASMIVSAIFLMIKSESDSTYEIRSAMLLYGTDLTRKLIIDKLQTTLKCCGSQTFEDWFVFDWKSQDFTKTFCVNLSDAGCLTCSYNWDSVPFSCCCLESPPPCIHHHLQTLGTDSLYSNGCAEKLDEAVFIFVSLAVALFTLLTLTLIILLYSARKLQTSARSAVCKGDATAPGTWWLLSPPGFGCRQTSEPDCVPLLDKRSEATSQATSKCDNKFKKMFSTQFLRKKAACQSDGEGVSDPCQVRSENRSTKKSSYMTTTVTNNAFLGSRQSVSDTAVANADVTRHFEPHSRSLYRS